VTFKDLKKRVTLETIRQQTKIFERLLNKPFWIWDQQQHKQEGIRINGDCCFNHIIGLPRKDGIDKPLHDYEEIILDSLVTHDGNTSSYDKQLDKEYYMNANSLYPSPYIIRINNSKCYLNVGLLQTI
jgi:hypothetical protein